MKDVQAKKTTRKSVRKKNEEQVVEIEMANPIALLGAHNSRLLLLRKYFPALQITARGGLMKASGQAGDTAIFKDKMERVNLWLTQEKDEIDDAQFEQFLQIEQDPKTPHTSISSEYVLHTASGKMIKARTANQHKIVRAEAQHDILFFIGPAGTGKTYLAVALALRALKNRSIKRIILTRPAVEAGERLGFLPGDMKSKIDPYLTPLLDALQDMLTAEKLNHYINTRVIEIAPLAYMRGRTLDDAYIILDEAQNATDLQIKMFLTRLGAHAKAIITGDLTQVDLPANQRSGLPKAIRLLREVKGIAHLSLDATDVVRHPLVREIIRAYDQDDARRSMDKNGLIGGQKTDA